MASYHLSVRVGKRGKAGPHVAYICRTGKYADRLRDEQLEAREHGNMPRWARHSPTIFWNAADEFERTNGSVYREFEIALPIELSVDQRIELVREFARQEFGNRHAYSWAIHNKKASLGTTEQPHAHIMFSERTVDGIERDPAQFFKRFNSKNPELGGCKKASGGKALAERRAELLDLRRRWADLQNAHLAKYEHGTQVDHRSLRDQRYAEVAPEPHLGPRKAFCLTKGQKAALQGVRDSKAEQRAALLEMKAMIPDLAAELREQIVALKERAIQLAHVVKLRMTEYKRLQAARTALLANQHEQNEREDGGGHPLDRCEAGPKPWP